MSKMMQTLKKC